MLGCPRLGVCRDGGGEKMEEVGRRRTLGKVGLSLSVLPWVLFAVYMLLVLIFRPG